MPKLLNRKRPFGIVTGEDTHGCCFEQDGTYYDHEGRPIEWGTGKPLPVDNVVVKPQVVRKDDEVGDELPEVINLQAWAMGKEKHHFHKVLKEIQKKYAMFPSNKKEAIRIIQMETPVA